MLFASLPTGESREPLARVPREVKIVDIGGDHRFVEGWTYGLAELPGSRAAIARSSRVANPGCYPAAALTALAPLVAAGPGRARGAHRRRQDRRQRRRPRRRASAFGYAEVNEDVLAYGLPSTPTCRRCRRR